MIETKPREVIWHDVECGGYAGDLHLWAELAGAHSAERVLEIGCGTGRVALELARRGHQVLGVDRVPAFVDAVKERAAARNVSGLAAIDADARELALKARFGLIILPMQVLQLLEGPAERLRLLWVALEHLAPGGVIAAAIVEGVPLDGEVGSEYEPPLPDVAEVDGWVYSSLPLGVASAGDRMIVTRLRQVVAPDGDLSEALARTSLAIVTHKQVEEEAGVAGLTVVGHREIEGGADYIGSTVVLMSGAGR
ncbi:MAG: class I SAM-dependent methyltransferase [Actinomycetota bacterium]|nr:class I SAM-dependent methyltransferase [Actinomycetota bacterium]